MLTITRVTFVAVLLAACGDRQDGTGWTISADTLPSGTVVVVNTPSAQDTGPRWILEEELRIGSVNDPGPTLFGQIKGLAVTEDGRIIVLEGLAQEVRIIAPDGRHFGTYGGRGGGPGEFQNALGIMRTSNDLLYVPDQRNARMTVLDPDSGFVRSYPFHMYRWGFVWNGAMRQDGHILVPSMTPETRRDLIRIYAPDMTQVDSVILPERQQTNPDDPPGAFAWQAPGGMPRGFIQVPFYANGALLLDRTGEIWSAYAGDPAYRIARWTPGGDTTLILRTNRAVILVTEAERDSAMAAILESVSRFGVRNLDASKIPRAKPAVLSLFTDDQGRLWVQTSSPDSLRRYDVYERNGRFVGAAVTSLKIVPWLSPVVRGDRFYAVVTDELDVPYVVRARLDQAEASR